MSDGKYYSYEDYKNQELKLHAYLRACLQSTAIIQKLKMKTIVNIPVKTVFLIIFLTIIVAGLTIAAFKIETPEPKKTVSLSLVPETVLSLSQNPVLASTPSASYYNEDILIYSKENRINSVQLELSFDPNVITVYDILPGTFFDSPQTLLKTIDNTNGRISFATSPAQGNASGTGLIATISFTLSRTQKIATQTSITFLPKTELSSADTLDSLLKEANSATFVVYPIISPIPTPRLFLNSSSSANFGSPSAR